MKIWIHNHWYTLPTELLVVYLTEQDKKNIVNMCPECSLYSQFDAEIFDVEAVKQLLKKLKKEVQNEV